MSHVQVQKTRPMNSSELTELLKRRTQAAQSKPAVKVQAASEVTERIRKQAACDIRQIRLVPVPASP